jgi:hypothetical protein
MVNIQLSLIFMQGHYNIILYIHLINVLMPHIVCLKIHDIPHSLNNVTAN